MKLELYDERTPPSVLLIRLIVGLVFLSEGIQKYLFQDALGVGRFIKIGIPAPEFFAPFVGAVEIVFGILIVIGLFTKLASIPLIIDISVAIISTKLPLLINSGFWAMAHEARVDFSMLLGGIFLLLVGSGKYSLDYYILKKKSKIKQKKHPLSRGVSAKRRGCVKKYFTQHSVYSFISRHRTPDIVSYARRLNCRICRTPILLFHS